MGFCPCVPCKQIGEGCYTNGKHSVPYHAELVQAEVMVYDNRCDFIESRKVKPEVRSRYERSMNHTMLDEEEEEEAEAEAEVEAEAGGNSGTRELVDAIHKLSKEMGRMQLRMQGMMGDMFRVTEELQRVNGRHSTSAAPPPDEHSSLAQPITDPISENNSTPPILPNAYGTHPINPPTPTIDSWMRHPSLNTPTESTWMQSNNVSYSDTHPYQFPAVPEAGTPTTGAHTDINLFDPTLYPGDSIYQDNSMYQDNSIYQGDSGPQYIEGSSTGLSARETGEVWQRDFAYDNEGMD